MPRCDPAKDAGTRRLGDAESTSGSRFTGAECLLADFERGSRIVHNQVRHDGVIPFGIGVPGIRNLLILLFRGARLS